LNTAIMRLREALCDSAEKPRFIETLPRHGYRFVAQIEEVTPIEQLGARDALTSREQKPGASAADLPASLPGTGQLKQEPQTGSLDRRPSLILAGLLAVTVFAVLIWVLRHPWNRAGSFTQPNRIKSVVVLPFENLSGDQEYFTDGMTDELIANLAKIRALRVISRTSSMAYKGTHKTMSQIARELNVDAVVEGTVLRSGNRVRITAELVQAIGISGQTRMKANWEMC
jgi:TolB-like protein